MIGIGDDCIRLVTANLLAVRGRFMVQKSRSDTHKLMMKAVVAWTRSFALRLRARMVVRFPVEDEGTQSHTLSLN